MKRNQPKVEQVEMNEITTKASRIAESRTACLIDESLRIARNNNQDPFRTLAVSAYLQGIQDALTPPAEPELPVPVCATCRGAKWIKCAACDGTGNFYGHDEDGDFLSCDDCYEKYGGDRAGTVPCPDCSAAQPASEQPRIWRVRNAQGILYGTGTCDEAEARKWVAELAGQTLVYSLDNGETWIDEQAEREGK